MLSTRVIPCLLLQGTGLVKTKKFKSPVYVGDSINAIKIFNDKEVDELILLDINATRENRGPNLKLIQEIAGECFMPLSYGGAIQSISDIESLLKIGVEKIIINTKAIEDPTFITEAAKVFGSSTIVISVDYQKDFFGRNSIYIKSGTQKKNIDPLVFIKEAEDRGAGEVMLNSISRDGQMSGYDIDFICAAVKSVSIPVIACGGAGSLNDLKELISKSNVSALAAGSLFVFHGPHRAILINYPSQKELKSILK